MESAYLLVWMCLAEVTLQPKAFTTLTGTNCLEVSAGSAGEMSLPLIGWHACIYNVRMTFQGGCLAESNWTCLTSGRPHFVKFGMVFQHVIGRLEPRRQLRRMIVASGPRIIGVRCFHAREKQKGPVCAIVEGDLFLSARSFLLLLSSSFFFLLLSSFFLLSSSLTQFKIFVGKKRSFRVGEEEKEKKKHGKTEGNPHYYPQLRDHGKKRK